jgi:hypothetical protein
MEDPYKRIQAEVDKSVALTNAPLGILKKSLIAALTGSLILFIVSFSVWKYQKHQEEQTKKAAAYSPPNIVSGTLIALPDRWTRVPIADDCLEYAITPTDRTAHFILRVNGSKIEGPFTAGDSQASIGRTRSVDVRSSEPYPIEIAYSMIK